MKAATSWLLWMLFCWSVTASAAVPTLVVDHATGKAKLGDQTYESGDEVRIRGGRLTICVTNTNTALYTYALKGEKVPTPELETLNTFFKGLKPYFAEAGKGLSAARTYVDEQVRKGPSEKSEAAKEADETLIAIDRAITGPAGIRDTALTALRFLQETSRGALTVEQAATAACERFRHRFEGTASCPPDSMAFTHLSAVSEIVGGLARLGGMRARLRVEEDSDTIRAIDGVLDDAEKVTAAAYHSEELAVAVVHARDTWKSEGQEITWEEGKALTLSIAPKKTAELARLAALGSLEFRITVFSDWPVRPSVGLSFLYSPNATYPVYSAVEAKDKSVSIRETGTNDQRFQWGLVLSTTWRGLDWREKGGVAVWLPELTVNPSDDVKAVAVGAAVSWRFVKFGGGVMWTRHKALDGQEAGGSLDSKDDLKTKDAYGRPNGYVSISFVGWEPFKAK